MRWLFPIVVVACARPPAPTCPVCPTPTPVAKVEAPAANPWKVSLACTIVEHGVRVVIGEMQRLAHDVVAGARILERLEKQQHGAYQEPLETTMASVYGSRPSWAFLVLVPKRTVAASSKNPPSLDVLGPLIAPEHTASLAELDGEWTLFTGSYIVAPTTGATMVFWRSTEFLAQLGTIANATVTVTDKVDADVRGSTCQPLDDNRMAIKVGAAYVVVAPP